jgi:hypothetical protein
VWYLEHVEVSWEEVISWAKAAWEIRAKSWNCVSDSNKGYL